MEFEELPRRVIGCAVEVHRELGPGLLESTYRQCLACELSHAAIPFQMESVEALLPIHQAQILTYMPLPKIPIGLLVNFNVTKLQNGIKRFVL